MHYIYQNYNLIVLTEFIWEIAGCSVLSGDGLEEIYDRCVMAVHAPDAVRILGDQATSDELRVLGAFQYVYRYLIELSFAVTIKFNFHFSFFPK